MSIDMTAMLNNSIDTNHYNADKIKNSVNSVSKETSDDELMQVCKDFESYFIEEVIKEIKNNMTEDEEDEDSSLATLTDFHMDSVIEEISDKVLDQSGMNLTQQLYEQMKRNYGIDKQDTRGQRLWRIAPVLVRGERLWRK